MGKHSVPNGQQSTSEKNGGPKHDTGKGGKHRPGEGRGGYPMGNRDRDAVDKSDYERGN